MVNTLGLLLGLGMALTLVGLHFLKGTPKPVPEDIASEVLEQRASTVPETDFPEPYNRSIGGGGGAGAVAGGAAEGELEEEGEEEEGFDPESIPEDEVEYYEIEFVKEGETIEVANNESILDAGEEEGWDLPYACRQGQCLSCGGRVASGEDSHDLVRHTNNETLSDDEMEKGYMLTCTAYPTAEFSIETDETP
ncbi:MULTISPECIES: 2Fe-2S iron-sulfur cluster-binding protein [unclassified Halobacterium]|jgi:2Fe-2S type ferredoxin|uniref:2Fe-2S iron-sulfur cluster-binding protein n=1 Tax=unclassified Halobacterium TaxID=2668073 RepID=UPI001E450380|nr:MULTISPECIES: 2Fe-2S iron-sulfur cluster-binding protein [unclassified Halobacterium]MCD2200173.1 2Fe-2S iron-sulfur cluster-binding protein [Halobacterium sp. KA-4]MCD2201753.1 2Fe-2S iron-sulfur cluster-binding protein [Halobacterium sp. KA-6]